MINTNSLDTTSWQIPAFEVLWWTGSHHPYCLVIPVINEGERLLRLLQKIADLKLYNHADILLIDGGSTDGSLEPSVLKSLGVGGVLLKTAEGKLSAQLRCAYAFALKADYKGIITIDGNDKDDPNAIFSFIEALEKGIDFVQGSRFLPGGIAEHTPLLRHIAIRWLHAPMLRLFSGYFWTDTTQGFRAYSRRLLLDPQVAPFRSIFQNYELLVYLSYRAPKLGYRCLELPTTRRYPKGGAIPTKITGIKAYRGLLQALFAACLGRYNPSSYK